MALAALEGDSLAAEGPAEGGKFYKSNSNNKLKVNIMKKNNWKKHLYWIIPAAILLLIVLYIVGSYNGLVKADVNVDNKWAQVETVYQRRADLIPNLVETVKGYQIHEQELLTEITEARSRWQAASTPQSQVAAANQMEGALGRLLVVVENYPNLKANENFLALQAELANTENKISVERMRYNDAVGEYNRMVRFFPKNIIASMFGFDQREFFESEAGAEEAPEVSFA